MATALKNDKIIGGMGIAAVIIFIVALFAAAMMKSGFDFGSTPLIELASETAFVAGCAIAGILGILFGFMITYKRAESEVFIGKIRGLAIILSGVALIAIGVTSGNMWTVYLFIVLIVLSVASDMFYNWVADQKIMMVFSLFFTLAIALTGILSQTGTNNALGFMFVLFVALWMVFTSAMRFAPVVEAEPEKGKKSKKDKTEKKNAPAPRPYPSKKEAAPQAKKKEAAPKGEAKKVEEPKKVEAKKEEPKPAESGKEELPKLKVMSSREAAAARESARKKEEEPKPEPVAEVKSEPTPEPEPVVEAEPEPVVEVMVEESVEITVEESVVEIEVEEVVLEVEETDEETEVEEFEMEEETPDALLRRATWNKGLRCRRDYGEHQIPIAFVKAKVAVYVVPEMGDTSIDETLRSEGWTVLRYLEADISDGKEQADEINKAVKENLKAERAAKKKKSKK